MQNAIKIGTRDSKLAVWQAETVKNRLADQGISSELVMVKSPADKDLNTPLHQFGDTGIFTKVLDLALLRNEIDIAVHSLKDYPTVAPDGIALPAVLERGSSEDILVPKAAQWNSETTRAIATGSIRRKAQWLHRFPNTEIEPIRGNVQTRLKKLQDSNWDGAIFAMAGLERIDLLPDNHVVLDWMLPAPAQGTIGICCREGEDEIIKTLEDINHTHTMMEVLIERSFLNTLEGGCSAPIGARATLKGDTIHFKGGIFEPDGSDKAVIEAETSATEWQEMGRNMAEQVLRKGGESIMLKIKNAGF